jgi:hypothetical protein
MEKFAKYLAAYDGTREWTEIQPLFADAFHPDCVFVTADGDMGKEQWEDMAKGLAAKGATAKDFEVTKEDGDERYYNVTITVPGAEPLYLTSKGTVRDGRLVRVEPVDPAAYSTMVERSR